MSVRRLSLLPAVFPALALAVATLAPASLASADGDDAVVVKVGPVSMTRKELERRLSHIPAMQLATFGHDPATVRRAYVEKVVVPEMLFAQGAEQKHEGDLPEVRARLLDAQRTAYLDVLKKEIVDGLTPDEIARYYNDNRDKFQTPERLNLWRILLHTRDDARKVIEEAKKPDGDRKWRDLARERSTDKATNERGGNLGFVGADGQSNEVTVKVDPHLFDAARKVKDGELVPEPVPEGEGFAVVWRRGSTPAVSRPLEQEAGTIRVTLSRQRLESRIKEVVERLRKEKVTDVSTDLLALVDVNVAGDVAQRKRPGVGKPKAPGKPAPNPSTMR